jgi:hypothetical protein
MDDGVAVGVGRRDVKSDEIIAVDMKRHRVAESHDRQRTRRGGRRAHVEHRVELLDGHALPHILVGHEQRAGFTHILVAARVVAVPVCVEHKLHRLLTHGRDRGENLLGQRRELVIHEKRSVVSDAEADVASRAGQHVHARAQMLRTHGNGVEVLREERAGDQGEEQSATDH